MCILKMMKTRWLYTALMFVIVFSLTGQKTEAQVYTGPQEVLDMYIRIAVENNPGLRAESAEADATSLQAIQARSLMNPEIEMEILSWARNPMPNGTTFRLRAMQMIPWFGSLGERERYYERISEAEEQYVVNSKNSLIREVTESWYMMNEREHHIMMIDENINHLTTLEQIALARLEGGGGSQVDVLRIQIERDKLINERDSMQRMLDADKVRFNRLLNRQTDAQIFLFAEMVTKPLPIINSELLQDSNPNLKALRLSESAASSAVEVARLEAKPSFGVGFMISHQSAAFVNPNGLNTIEAMVRLELPIYRTRNKARVQQAQLRQQAIRDYQEEMVNSLESDLMDAMQRYTNARQTAQLYQDQLIPALEQALSLAMTDYSYGRGTFEQIIQLQRQLIEFEKIWSESVTNQNLAVTEIEYLTGEGQ
jgi:outer membrane protein TolC